MLTKALDVDFANKLPFVVHHFVLIESSPGHNLAALEILSNKNLKLNFRILTSIYEFIFGNTK